MTKDSISIRTFIYSVAVWHEISVHMALPEQRLPTLDVGKCCQQKAVRIKSTLSSI